MGRIPIVGADGSGGPPRRGGGWLRQPDGGCLWVPMRAVVQERVRRKVRVARLTGLFGGRATGSSAELWVPGRPEQVDRCLDGVDWSGLLDDPDPLQERLRRRAERLERCVLPPVPDALAWIAARRPAVDVLAAEAVRAEGRVREPRDVPASEPAAVFGSAAAPGSPSEPAPAFEPAPASEPVPAPPGGGHTVAPVVVDLRAAGVRRSRDDADLVVAVRGVVEHVQERERERRAERGKALGRGSRELSRAVRLAAIGEIEVALGFSAWEAGLLVRAATVEEPLAGMVDAALRAGETMWVQVRSFYEKTASLEEDQRLLVAAALFGDDAGLAAADRLDPDGDLHGRAWSVPLFKAALDAEVEACRGTDVEEERAARARAYAARRMWTTVHQDGMATLHVRGPVASVLAAEGRVGRAARGVNALGDPRTQCQLEVDLALGILNFATIALGACPDKPTNPAPDIGKDADAGDGAGDGAGQTVGGPTSTEQTNPAPDGLDDDADDHGPGHDADGEPAPGEAWDATDGNATTNVPADHDQADATDDCDDTQPDGDPGGDPDGRASPGSAAFGPAASGDGCGCGCSCEGQGQGMLFDEIIAPDDMELLARVVNGLPPVSLQVVVPYSTLAGGFPICGHCSGPLDAPEPRDTGQDPAHDRPPGTGEDSARRGPPDWALFDSDDEADPPERSGSSSSHRGRRRRAGPPGRSGRGRVGEVLGPNPFFVSEGHARELALMPGTTLHRLVVDPRDGRLVERTITGYKPDADMRRQVVAADVYSRAPGARARTGELDHVTPYGWAGGPTSEANLALLAKRPHQYKTDGTWQVVMGARRDLTFTTLLGQVVTTRVHDYRTYLRRVHPGDLEERRDLAGQLLQAALADQARARRPCREDRVRLDHVDPLTGAVRPGPHPGQPTLDDLLTHLDDLTQRTDGTDGPAGYADADADAAPDEQA